MFPNGLKLNRRLQLINLVQRDLQQLLRVAEMPTQLFDGMRDEFGKKKLHWHQF